MEDVLERGISGDFIETGVWRGGAVILMRAVLKAYGVRDRRVWAADSFEGLPPPDPDNSYDRNMHLNQWPFLAVSLEQVRANFERYGLLDEQVFFLKGWFRDTLPTIGDQHFAVIRLDGDLYHSTMEALTHLYPKLSLGGWLIVDDYGNVDACFQAVHDYRDQHGIDEPVLPIDGWGVYWQRTH
jgi:O-methyltransferase